MNTAGGRGGAATACVRGRSSAGEEWVEVTRMLDASHTGASFVLARAPRLGQLLHVTLPPRRHASDRRARAEEAAPTYNGQWSLVWAISPQERDDGAESPCGVGGDADAPHKVSVTFVGNDLPRRYVTSAGKDFGFEFEQDGFVRLHERLALVGSSEEKDRRRKGTRLALPVEVTLDVLGEDGYTTAREVTVTENISRGGAAVWTALAVEPGARLRMWSAPHRASVVAVVRRRRAGADGITRLHLEFVEGRWPLEGLR